MPLKNRYRAVRTYLESGGGGGANIPTRPNCKPFTCRLVLVAILQDFHARKKVGPPVPTALRYGTYSEVVSKVHLCPQKCFLLFNLSDSSNNEYNCEYINDVQSMRIIKHCLHFFVTLVIFLGIL